MFPIVEESQMGGPQAIADIAAYISTLLMDSFPAAGEGDRLPEAEVLYRKTCARCHGLNGEGNFDLHYPLIQDSTSDICFVNCAGSGMVSARTPTRIWPR